MKDIDALDILKTSEWSNQVEWFRKKKIISFCVITKLIGRNVAVVQEVIRGEMNNEKYAVPIVSVRGFAFEVDIQPQVGDMVVVLFLNKYNRRMFESALKRFADTEQWSLYDPRPHGYDRNSGIGFLLSPARGHSDTVLRAVRTATSSTVELSSVADWFVQLRSKLSMVVSPQVAADIIMTFDELAHPIIRVLKNASFDFRQGFDVRVGIDHEDEQMDSAPVSILLGDNSPFSIDSTAPLTLTFKDVIIEATDTLTLKVGTTEYKLTSSGIEATADRIDLN